MLPRLCSTAMLGIVMAVACPGSPLSSQDINTDEDWRKLGDGRTQGMLRFTGNGRALDIEVAFTGAREKEVLLFAWRPSECRVSLQGTLCLVRGGGYWERVRRINNVYEGAGRFRLETLPRVEYVIACWHKRGLPDPRLHWELSPPGRSESGDVLLCDDEGGGSSRTVMRPPA
ncbi:MAG TPA: hypothetical protein VHG08_20580 [Longimicrobium sp.]|nr:hypothetical protein [Longimicrobium sp.]